MVTETKVSLLSAHRTRCEWHDLNISYECYDLILLMHLYTPCLCCGWTMWISWFIDLKFHYFKIEKWFMVAHCPYPLNRQCKLPSLSGDTFRRISRMCCFMAITGSHCIRTKMRLALLEASFWRNGFGYGQESYLL